MSYAVMPKEDYKNTCDKVREKTSETEAIKSGKLADKVDEVYNAGQKTIWDMVTANNTRKDWSYAFQYWNSEYLRPPFVIRPTEKTIANMFTGNTLLKAVEAKYFDFSGYTPTQTNGTSAWYKTFDSCHNLEEVENIGMQAGGYYRTFANCYALRKIDLLKSQAETVYNTAFASCNNLIDIEIDGIIGQNGFDIHWSTKLSKDSILSILQACARNEGAELGIKVTLPLYCIDRATDTETLINNDNSLYGEMMAARTWGYTFLFNKE